MEIARTDNRRVLGELASNRAAMAGLSTEMTAMRGDIGNLHGALAIVRGEVGAIRETMGAILTELREMRVQNASFDNRLRRLEETTVDG